MFSIETITKLDKRWRLLLMFMFVLVFIISTVSLCFYVQHIQNQQKAISLEKSVSTLRTQALKAQTDGNLDKADSLYTQALAEAESSGSSMKIIEFLSRLVQVKIQNHKLGQTDALVQKAIKLALSIKDTTASDSNLEVWMDDMANAFYKRGEHSTREDIKEYCLKHYLDIKLPIEDHYDPLLVGKAHLLIAHLSNDGRDIEASPYGEKLCDYLKRTKPNDPNTLASVYLALSDIFAQRHQFANAESSLKQCFILRTKLNGSQGQEADLDFHLGLLKEKEGNLQAARIFYRKALELEKQCAWTVRLGVYENTLGFVEQRLGNIAEAAKLYAASLDRFYKCPITKDDSANAQVYPARLVYSGRVFAAEHLAQIALQKGNLMLAHALQAQAKGIRLKNPEWATCKHPDPDSVYPTGGMFPFPLEIIPTHFSLQEIDQK